MQKTQESAATEWIERNAASNVRTDGIRWQVLERKNYRIGGTLAKHMEDMKVILSEHPDAKIYSLELMCFAVFWWKDATEDHPLVIQELEIKAGLEKMQKQQEESAIDFLRRTRPEVLKTPTP